MEKRIIEAKRNTLLLNYLSKDTLKALKAVVSDKELKFRQILTYVHYNPEKKRLEVTNGRVMVFVNAAYFMPEPEREGFFKINGDLLIEEEYEGMFPHTDRCIPQNCDTIATVNGGFENKDGAYRCMALTLLTGYIFNASTKWLIGALEASLEWNTIEWKKDSQGAVILKDKGENTMAVLMPMATKREELFKIEAIQKEAVV